MNNVYKQRKAILNTHYKKINGSRCIYCGDLMQTHDHVPALDTAYAMGVDLLRKKYGADFLLVPACNDCNTHIPEKPTLSDVESRKQWIAKRLFKQGLKNKMPMWSNDELQELDGQLLDYVNNKSAYWDAFKRRIEWALQPANLVIL